MTRGTEPIDGLCNAKTRAGGYCTRRAGWGTDHVGFGKCKKHMGATPAVRKAAYREMAAAYGISIDIEPDVALLNEVHRAAGHVAWLGSVVANLKWDPEHPNTVYHEGGLVGMNKQGELVPSVWVRMYQAERDRLVTASSQALRAGIAERRVKLAEDQGALVAHAFHLLIQSPDLGLSERQRAAAPAAMRVALEAVKTIDVEVSDDNATARAMAVRTMDEAKRVHRR